MSVRAGKWGECSEVIADQSRGPNGRVWVGGDGDELEDMQGRSAGQISTDSCCSARGRRHSGEPVGAGSLKKMGPRRGPGVRWWDSAPCVPLQPRLQKPECLADKVGLYLECH